MDYRKIITIEAGKRSGKPCIRGLRVTVYDVLDYLAAGMTNEQILKEFPYLTEEDIRSYVRRFESVTDDHPYTEFPLDRFLRKEAPRRDASFLLKAKAR